MTRLGLFLLHSDVLTGQLARLAGISRQHLYRLRFGLMEPTRPVMIWLTLACRRILAREVLVTELFDLESDPLRNLAAFGRREARGIVAIDIGER